jgi:hypothetical protein
MLFVVTCRALDTERVHVILPARVTQLMKAMRLTRNAWRASYIQPWGLT